MDLIFSNSYQGFKAWRYYLELLSIEPSLEPLWMLMKKSGYVTEEHAIEIARKHGFELVAKSEINANPKDTKNYPRGSLDFATKP